MAEAQPGQLLQQEPAAEPGLEELRARADKIEAWLSSNDISHARWQEGLAAYAGLRERIETLEEELQAEEDGPLHYLRQPGDEFSGVVIFPADTPGPLIEGTYERLEDGRIEARLSLFQLRIMREMRAILAGADTEA